MNKICPNCGNPLPEEASFCLNCSSRTDTDKGLEDVICDKKAKDKTTFFKSKRMISVYASAFTVALVIFIITCVPLPSLSKSGSGKSTPVYVPVTDSNGEAVTDENGETVYETQPLEENTNPKTIFQALFEKNDKDKNNGTENEASTSKKSILDSIFGKNDNTSEAQTDGIDNTEQISTSESSGTSPNSSKEESRKPDTVPDNNQTEPTVSSVGEFTYDIYKDLVRIVSYTGNAEIVTVPSKISGIDVGYIGADAFSNNSNIKIIKFQGAESRLTLRETSIKSNEKSIYFNNLPNLTQIVFPKNTYINFDTFNNNFSNMFKSCPKLSAVTFDSGSGSSLLSSENGVVYYTSGSNNYLIYYPCAKTNSNFTVPQGVNNFLPNSMNDNPYIKSLNFNGSANTLSLTPNFTGCTNLESFYIPSGNSKVYTVDGIVYMKNHTTIHHAGVETVVCTQIVYPPAKKNSHYDFYYDTSIYFNTASFCGNPYLKSFRAPDKSRFSLKYNMFEKIYLYDSEDQRTYQKKDHVLSNTPTEFYK